MELLNPIASVCSSSAIMNQYFGAITMLIRMCEAQKIAVQGRPPNPLDSQDSNLPAGSLTIPGSSLPETPTQATLEAREEHRAGAGAPHSTTGPVIDFLCGCWGMLLTSPLSSPEPAVLVGPGCGCSISLCVCLSLIHTYIHTHTQEEKMLVPSGFAPPAAMLDLG